jgi:hypothetical protein
MKKLTFLVVVSLLAISCTSGPSIPRNAVVLGEEEVNFTSDHDLIRVGAYEGFFKSLFFVVERNDIQIFNLIVDYGDGQKESFATRLSFDKGSRSRSLVMEGGQRRIETIAFTYQTVGSWSGGKANVVVYGVR